VFVFTLCLAIAGMAPDVAGQEADVPRKQAHAVRVASGAIRVDGRLDEEQWLKAQPITDFLQAEPVEGAAPTDPMEIRFVYDEGALYVGARMRHSGTGPVRAAMSRRDDGNQAEYLQIELDTYLDRRTAYMFGVTASGVRLDHFHPSDDEGNSDSGFDPVWEARTQISADGWTAELWLPFAQLRFNDTPERVWGLNVKRWRPDLNEEDYWVVVGRTERGWASRFGDLRGIEGVRPARRIEILPYVAGSSTMTGDRNFADPFDDGRNLVQRVGADLKFGVGSNLTLEATVNPDFGQIEADPAEVNLSAFETFFSERRPFFLEGSNLLQAATSNFFYSRRIGARPTGPAPGDFTDYPSTATILGAAKLTGRLPSGTSIGVLGAATNEEHAETFEDEVFGRVRVAPRAYWGVGRVQQEFGSEGSTFGVHGTVMHRDLGDGDPLGSRLVRNAVTFAADTDLRFKNRTYEAGASIGMTFVEGDPAAIERVQRSNGHLFHRPDRDDVQLDPTRTMLSGLQFVSNLDKVGGRHWLWGYNLMVESPEFEPNEMGRLNYAGDVQMNGRITYRETQPGRLLRSYSFQFNSSSTSYFQTSLGARVSSGGNANLTFPNFWGANFSVTRNFRGQDAQLTRGGPSMGTPLGVSMNASLRNSGSSVTRWNFGGNRSSNEHGDRSWGIFASLTTRPSPAWQLSIEPDYSQSVSHRQYVTARDGGRVETFGRRYIFGTIDRSTLSMQVRFSYTFKPDLTLDVYSEPFAASGRYEGFGELEASRSRLLRVYGEAAGTGLLRNADGSFLISDVGDTFTLNNGDFNVRSFRSNVVLRWEWRPGSTLYVVWQQDRSSDDPTGAHVGPGDLFESFSVPGDNVVAVKTTWWLSR
jgi:hypothetical protein